MWSWLSLLGSGRGGLSLVLVLLAGPSYVGFFSGLGRRGDFHRRGLSPSTRVFPGGAVSVVSLVLLQGGRLPAAYSLSLEAGLSYAHFFFGAG